MDQNNRISIWAPPSAGGAGGMWGPWYAGAVIAQKGNPWTFTLSFESISDAPSPFIVEARYYKGDTYVKELYGVNASGEVTLNIAGGNTDSISNVYIRLKSVSIGQIVEMDPGPAVELVPGLPEPQDLPTFQIIRDWGLFPPQPEPFFTSSPLPDWVPGVTGSFGTAEVAGSPLVIDVDGDGIELSALNGTGAVYWDIDADGFREASGWIAGGDGLLALDRNDNGTIDANTCMGL